MCPLFINVVGLAPSAVQNAPSFGPNHATLGRHELAPRALASFIEFRAKALMPFILAQSVSSSAAVLSQSVDEVIE
jgi:hypothetical protein